MQLQTIDWVVVVAYGIASLAIGVLFTKRAGRSLEQYFLSGRKLPWWLLGTSMVATTFSTDTPNLVTDMVRNGGVSMNWLWWAFLITGMLTVFFYAKLWRRSGALTDINFYELRYSGTPAAFLRGFRADLSRRLLQRDDHGDGDPRRHQDRRRPARPRPLHHGRARRADHHGLLHDLGPVGRRRHRLLPVRPGDDRLVRGRLLRRLATERRAGLADWFLTHS